MANNTTPIGDPYGAAKIVVGKEADYVQDAEKSGYFSIITIASGSGAERFRISAAGNITGTHGNYHTSSDVRLKRNVVTIPNALTKVMALRGVNFIWKSGTMLLKSPADVANISNPELSVTNPPVDDTSVKMGLIAQEVEAVIPEIVHTSNVYRDADGVIVPVEHGATPPAGATPTKSVEYEYLTGLLIEAIKELKEEVNIAAAKIVVLEG